MPSVSAESFILFQTRWQCLGGTGSPQVESCGALQENSGLKTVTRGCSLKVAKIWKADKLS